MFVAIKDNDVDVLRVLARRSDQVIGKTVFPGFASAGRFPEDILGAFRCYIAQLGIRIMWWDLPDFIYALHFSSIDGGHQIIAVNEKMRGVDEEWTGLRDVKPLVLHELAHIVQEHPAAYVPPAHEEEPELNRFKMLYNMIMHHAIASHTQFENEAEVFAAALGFWPGNVFLRQISCSKGDFRRVANFFKMPIDCAIKWAILSQPNLNIHYLKFNVRDRTPEDYHIPAHYTTEDFPWDFLAGGIVNVDETAAKKCLDAQDDAFAQSRAPSPQRTAEYWCYAFYERVSASKSRTSDKLLVGGYPLSIYGILKGEDPADPR